MGPFENVRDNLKRVYGTGRRALSQARAESRVTGDAEHVTADAEAVTADAEAATADAEAATADAGRVTADAEPAVTDAGSGPGPAAPDGGSASEVSGFRPPPAAPRPIVVASTSLPNHDDLDVPRGLRVAAAWAWRILLLVLAGSAVLWLIAVLQLVVVPLVIGLLLSALLSPLVGMLLRAKLPRSLAVTVVMITGIAAVAGVLTLVINQFVQGAPELSAKATTGILQIQHGLRISDERWRDLTSNIGGWFTNNGDALTAGALSTATTLGHVLTGLFLVLFTTFFFLRDGRRITRFLIGLLPQGTRAPLLSAADVSWGTLVNYVRATVLVAFIDAVGIGLAMVILHVPFPFPLAALVFLGAFIPIVGATVSGAVAVLVAFVDQGWVVALILLGAVIGVQQLEGHVLQPLIMGRAVAIHPLAVILAIAAGIVLAGIVGALVAVPIVATLNTGIRHLAKRRRAEESGSGDPGPIEPTGPPMPGGADEALSPLPPGV